jgi:hypothetical protein
LSDSIQRIFLGEYRDFKPILPEPSNGLDKTHHADGFLNVAVGTFRVTTLDILLGI